MDLPFAIGVKGKEGRGHTPATPRSTVVGPVGVALALGVVTPALADLALPMSMVLGIPLDYEGTLVLRG
jgi:hypothetical protein